MRKHAPLYLVLLLMGATWGITPVLMKIAVNGGYKPLGIIFWSGVIGFLLSVFSTALRGRRLFGGRRHIGLYIGIALLGAVLPNYFSYVGITHLPAGIMSIIIALVPMFAMPIALALGLEKFSTVRLFGALCGLGAIFLIAGPEASLPDPDKAIYVFIAILAPLFYGGEGNFLIRFGARGLDPLQILLGASLVSAALTLPVALAAGQFANPLTPWGAPEWAIVGTAVISWGTYVSYIWLIGRAGAVFASQVAYTVTGWGVVWAMLLLGERYSLWVWAAFALILFGILLVQPRESEPEG